MIEVNYWAILLCTVLSMVVGTIWYGPLFSKKWMEINGVNPNNPNDTEERRKMQKGVGKLYAVQFVLSIFQVYVLAHFINGWQEASGIESALWIYAAFIIPILAANSMWTNDSSKIAWSRFLIQAGYYLVLFVIYGFVLGAWR